MKIYNGLAPAATGAEQSDRLHETAAAALDLLRTISQVTHLCWAYHPDGDVNPLPSLSEEVQKEVRESLSCWGDELRSGLSRLSQLLDREDVWRPLSLANDFPASVGRYHAPCFAAGVFRVAQAIFESMLYATDRRMAILWRSNVDGAIPSLEPFPGLVREAIEQKASEIIRLAAREVQFDVQLAELQVAKELQRASGGKLDPGVATHSSFAARGQHEADAVTLTLDEHKILVFLVTNSGIALPKSHIEARVKFDRNRVRRIAASLIKKGLVEQTKARGPLNATPLGKKYCVDRGLVDSQP